MASGLFTGAGADVTNPSRFVVSVVSVHNHLDLDLLTSFFPFGALSTTDERFRVEMLRRLSC